ncbi:MAG: hypothetical protein QMB65_10465, partial [Vicingaceae bacterium]
MGIENFFIASIIARFIIALEIFLGLSIIFDSWFKDIIYKLTLTSLGLFSAYLVYLLVTKVNRDDCGCFESWLAVSPKEYLIKNVCLIPNFCLSKAY